MHSPRGCSTREMTSPEGLPLTFTLISVSGRWLMAWRTISMDWEHFEEADLGTGPAVAVEDGHGREPEFREGFVFRLAHVLSHAAAAQGRPGGAELDGFLSGHHADAHRTLFDGVVFHGHLFEAAHFGFKGIHFVEDPALVLTGEILAHARRRCWWR